MPPELLIANLECEQDWATPDKRPRALPRTVLVRLSAMGSLVAALGRPGDVLWTPLPVDPGRATLASARGVELVSCPRQDLGRPSATPGQATSWGDIQAWGETRWVEALRAGAIRSSDPHPRTIDSPSGSDRARLGNDRRYAFALNQDHGELLPGARVVSSLQELEAHLAAGGHAFGHLGAAPVHPGTDLDQRTWVLEAPFAASGRFRLRRRGCHLDPASRMRAWRLFATFGQLIFQPWMERTLDMGCVGEIHPSGRWSLIGHHILDTDRAGVFRGMVLGSPSSLADDQRARAAALRERMLEYADLAARRLAGDGYRGPFGIDGFTYRDPQGHERVHPLCEINARMTFGLLAHALWSVYPCESLRLVVAEGPWPDADPRVVPLLAPGRDDPMSAWLVRDDH